VNSPSGPPARALVVDDDPASLELVAEVLRNEGFEVNLAGNATIALDWLRGQTCEVIVSDYKMPGMTGLDLFHEARSIRPDTSRVLMTGVVDVDLVVAAINSGDVFRFVIKPWLREEFLSIVRDAALRHALLRQDTARREEACRLSARVEDLERVNRSLAQQVQVLTERCQHLQARMPGDVALDKSIYNARGIALHS
jgi:DNA-binding NtrC family response regulator